MSVWDELVGQQEAIDVFRAASESELASATSHDSAMTHSWLVTGPPGSGRSNLAYAFAASLLCRDGGCGKCSDCTQVAARTHPDLATLTTSEGKNHDLGFGCDTIGNHVTSEQALVIWVRVHDQYTAGVERLLWHPSTLSQA